MFENKEVSYRNKGWMVTQFHNFKAIFLKGINIKDKKISFEICKYLKVDKFDHIIIGVYSTVTQMIAQEYMKIKKIPYIISSDGGIIKDDSKMMVGFKRHFIGAASAWLSTGKITTEYLTHYGASANNIYIYPFTSIDVSDILECPDTVDCKMEFRKQLGIKEKHIVLSVGQFIHRKGFDVLLQASGFLSNMGIYIVGGEPTEEYLELRNRYDAKNVHFIGFKNKSELSKYYRAADVFVLPTREDIWGLVINEAMAYGLPVVTTNKCVAGVEMINEETGSIVPTDDAAQLAKAILSCSVRKKSSIDPNAILETARKYTIQEMAQCHLEILKKISE